MYNFGDESWRNDIAQREIDSDRERYADTGYHPERVTDEEMQRYAAAVEKYHQMIQEFQRVAMSHGKGA